MRANEQRGAPRTTNWQTTSSMLVLDRFLDEWLAQPLFAGLTLDDGARADRLTNTPEGLASSLRLAGTGAQGSLWPRPPRDEDASVDDRRRTGPQVCRDRSKGQRPVPRGKAIEIPGARPRRPLARTCSWLSTSLADWLARHQLLIGPSAKTEGEQQSDEPAAFERSPRAQRSTARLQHHGARDAPVEWRQRNLRALSAAHARHATAITMIRIAAARDNRRTTNGFGRRRAGRPGSACPTRRSVGMSRRLLMTSNAHARNPRRFPRPTRGQGTPRRSRMSCRWSPPARRRRTRTTHQDRGIRTASGRRCIPSRPASATRPTRISHQVVASAKINPAIAATPNAMNAARFHVTRLARPPATSRTGPTRTSSVLASRRCSHWSS